MEAIKLKLSQTEAGAISRFLNTLPLCMDPTIMALCDFRDKFWKRVLVHGLSGKQLCLYTIPTSVAVAFWRLWQLTSIEPILQGVLAKIDQVLTDRGLKRARS